MRTTSYHVLYVCLSILITLHAQVFAIDRFIVVAREQFSSPEKAWLEEEINGVLRRVSQPKEISPDYGVSPPAILRVPQPICLSVDRVRTPKFKSEKDSHLAAGRNNVA